MEDKAEDARVCVGPGQFRESSAFLGIKSLITKHKLNGGLRKKFRAGPRGCVDVNPIRHVKDVT